MNKAASDHSLIISPFAICFAAKNQSNLFSFSVEYDGVALIESANFEDLGTGGRRKLLLSIDKGSPLIVVSFDKKKETLRMKFVRLKTYS